MVILAFAALTSYFTSVTVTGQTVYAFDADSNRLYTVVEGRLAKPIDMPGEPSRLRRCTAVEDDLYVDGTSPTSLLAKVGKHPWTQVPVAQRPRGTKLGSGFLGFYSDIHAGPSTVNRRFVLFYCENGKKVWTTRASTEPVVVGDSACFVNPDGDVMVFSPKASRKLEKLGRLPASALQNLYANAVLGRQGSAWILSMDHELYEASAKGVRSLNRPSPRVASSRSDGSRIWFAEEKNGRWIGGFLTNDGQSVTALGECSNKGTFMFANSGRALVMSYSFPKKADMIYALEMNGGRVRLISTFEVSALPSNPSVGWLGKIAYIALGNKLVRFDFRTRKHTAVGL
jgi:hypothetical protein